MDQATGLLLEVPPPLRARRPAGGDAAAITALYLRVDGADLGKPDTDEDDVTGIWSQPGFDRARDAVVVVDEGDEPVGYAWVHRGREGDVAVDPAWRGRGIGRALLGWAVRRAGEQAAEGAPGPDGAPQGLKLYALTTNAAAARLLDAAGFARARIELLMRIDLTAPPPEPAWPAGVTPRPFDADRDARALHALVAEAFGDIEGTTARSFEEWSQFTLRRSTFDPTLVVLAEAGGEPVGATLSFDFDGEGYVQYLAVRRAWRRRGLGLALLQHTFATLARRAITRIELTVDAENSTGATRLYERAGMREIHRWDRWQRPLPT